MILEEIIRRNSGNYIGQLARHVLSLKKETKKEPIYENVVLQGTTSSTTARLRYGLNIISSATGSDRCARLPEPPIKGQTVVVINVSGQNISLFPSYAEGTINNAINGEAIIPSDGKPYVFICWENPLPGAWAWSPPAVNQYNSGEILMTAPSTTGYISAVDPQNINLNSQNDASSGIPFNGKTKSLIINQANSGYYFKPSQYWNEITKIKVYTNTNAPGTFYLKYTFQVNYYNPTTGVFVDSGVGGSGDVITENISTAVPGVFVPSAGKTYSSDFIGNPGTLYHQSLISSLFGLNKVVGDKFLGQIQHEGNLVDAWYTGYLKFIFIPNGSVGNVAGVKFQFFIEYN